MEALALALKQELLKQCEALVAERLRHAREVMTRAGHDAQAEQKSAMGDKYETARAAAHLQQENASFQLAEANKLWESLRLIRPQATRDRVGPGSLVQSTRHWFFLAISVGPVVMEGTIYFVVSPQAPIGKSLVGKQVGDSFAFQGQTEIITAWW